jgi:hypothetical protein
MYTLLGAGRYYGGAQTVFEHYSECAGICNPRCSLLPNPGWRPFSKTTCRALGTARCPLLLGSWTTPHWCGSLAPSCHYCCWLPERQGPAFWRLQSAVPCVDPIGFASPCAVGTATASWARAPGSRPWGYYQGELGYLYCRLLVRRLLSGFARTDWPRCDWPGRPPERVLLLCAD